MAKQKEFIKLIQKNEGILFKISGLYSDNVADGKDLRQEMIYQLWKSYDTFKGLSKISTWIYKVCLNTGLVFVKKNNHVLMNVESIETLEEVFQLTDNYNSEFSDQILHLYQSIKKLNKIERGIILLHLEGNSYQEISEITGYTQSNVGTRLGRIKNKLTALMQGK
jgi:RNA polymerase sigma-70 factor (ECF subfamily)